MSSTLVAAAMALLIGLAALRSLHAAWRAMPWHRSASGASDQLRRCGAARPFLSSGFVGKAAHVGYVTDGDFGLNDPERDPSRSDAYRSQYSLLPILFEAPHAGQLVVATFERAGSIDRARAAGHEVVADLGEGLFVLRWKP